jgi:hypothetical protein
LDKESESRFIVKFLHPAFFGKMESWALPVGRIGKSAGKGFGIVTFCKNMDG